MPPNGKTSPTNLSTLSADAPVILIPYGDDPLRHLATLLLDRHQDELPDLSQHVVLLPHTSAVSRFRRILREQAARKNYPALLPPFTGTLTSWAARFADSAKHRLSTAAREILLFDLLHDYPPWRREYGDWPLADSLLELFDGLALHECRLPDKADDLIQKHAESHGADMDDFSPLNDESRLVHTLWNAWRERLQKNNLQDQALQFIDGLARSLDQLAADTKIYLAGFMDFSNAELNWIKALIGRHRLTCLLHGTGDKETGNSAKNIADQTIAGISDVMSRDAYADFLDQVYTSGQGHLQQRARKQAEATSTSPAHGRLILHQAADAESEARAIDLQVRRWLTQDLRDIGIVTNDRKLARRVRALLERAHIGLVDAGGWTLSTTSAATALARWLECVEQNFAHEPLLDLLKSPFLQLDVGHPDFNRLVSLFEQGVIRSNNITSGLDQYRHGLERARAAWPDEHTDTNMALTRLIDRLESAASPLISLTTARLRPLSEFLETLQKSLENLGLSAGFENDDAGRELLHVLDEMHAAARHSKLRLAWVGFHQWLRRGMEQRRFQPPMQGRGVELMSFAESRLYRFDAIIIAGAVREHLPGQLGAPPYFNDSVRTELGLPSLARRYATLFHDFRRLLEAAPRVLVSLRREHDGERLVPSPWVERLRTFHDLAYGSTLSDPELEWLVQQAGTMIVNRDAPLPSPVAPPAARLPASMLPVVFTATDCKRLIDCPYQFFAARGLSLAPEDEVSEEIEKRDYGNHVHRILQAFHGGVSGLPGPWRGKIDDANRPEAEAMLHQISEKVFARDLRRRFLSRGWLFRWEKCIPAYVEWEMKRAAHWQAEASEIKREKKYIDGATQITLAGRIDRLDHGQDGYGIIDYKTGSASTHNDVLQGEAIQLPFYALLLDQENIAQATYLALEDGDVREKTILDGQTLALLRTAVRERLISLKRRLDASAPLPAWGDMETCRVCEMEGLCRREMWAKPESPAP